MAQGSQLVKDQLNAFVKAFTGSGGRNPFAGAGEKSGGEFFFQFADRGGEALLGNMQIGAGCIDRFLTVDFSKINELIDSQNDSPLCDRLGRWRKMTKETAFCGRQFARQCL